MVTLHSTPRIINMHMVGLTDKKTYKNVIHCSPFLLNNSKHNKNIINSYGLFIIGVIFCILLVLNRLFSFGWINQSNAIYHYSYASFCFAPVILSTVYFMRNPKHLISVLQDHNLMQTISSILIYSIQKTGLLNYFKCFDNFFVFIMNIYTKNPNLSANFRSKLRSSIIMHIAVILNTGLQEPGVPWQPQILADQVTISQPGGGGRLCPPHYQKHPQV